MSRHNFKYEETREPALRPDGKLYAEHLLMRVDEIRVNDVVTEVGTVMKVERHGESSVVSGRLLHRMWPNDKIVDVVRRNWD